MGVFLFLFSFYLSIFGCTGPHCCRQAFSNYREQGLLSSCSARAPLQWLPLLWIMGSQVCGLSSCNTWVSLCHSMRSLSGLEIKPTSSELASGFLTLDLQGSQITCILILAPPLTICVTLSKLFTISTLLFAHPWQTATTRDFRYSHPSIILSC